MLRTITKFISRLFKPKHTKYVGTCKCQLSSLLGDGPRTVSIAVYQKYDPISGKIYAAWGKGAGAKIHFNVDAFARGILIEK